jgi:hypothetical protein
MPASTVTEYLAADQREALNEVRRGINRALPPEYKERNRSELTIRNLAERRRV